MQVDSANEHGILLEVVQVLTDLNLMITKAYISSDGGWFMDGNLLVSFFKKTSYALYLCSFTLLLISETRKVNFVNFVQSLMSLIKMGTRLQMKGLWIISIR